MYYYYYSRSLALCHSGERKRRGILFVKDFSLPLEMTKLDESSQCLVPQCLSALMHTVKVTPKPCPGQPAPGGLLLKNIKPKLSDFQVYRRYKENDVER